MRPYRVEWSRRATKDLRTLGSEAQFRVRRAVELLADNPRHPGVVKLTGRMEHRLRVGDYRVLFEILDEALVVLVVAVRKREDAY